MTENINGFHWGEKTLLMGSYFTPFITGRVPPCRSFAGCNLFIFFSEMVGFLLLCMPKLIRDLH